MLFFCLCRLSGYLVWLQRFYIRSVANRRVSVVEKNVQQRSVDLDIPVVLDVSGLTKSIHEEVYPRPGAADDGSESLLTDLRDIGLRLAGFAEVCHVKQCPREPFLGGVEELVDKVVLNAARGLKEISDT